MTEHDLGVLVDQALDAPPEFLSAPAARVAWSLRHRRTFPRLDVGGVVKRARRCHPQDCDPECRGERVVSLVSGGECRICGCTDENCQGCFLATGAPCYWVTAERDVCSACAGAHEART